MTLTVPSKNIDQTTPADVTRVDVYGYTGRVAPPRARWAELGTLVGTVPVVPAPRPGDPVTPPPPPEAGATQGGPVTIVDTLTGDELQQGRVDPPSPPGRGRAPVQTLPVTPAAPGPLKRFYLAIPFGPNGVNGPFGANAELTVTDLPERPTDVVIEYGAVGLGVRWDPSGGLIGFILDREIPMEQPPFDETPALGGAPAAAPAIATLPPGPTTYNVYRDVAPDPLELPGAAAIDLPWRAAPPAPIAPNVPTLSIDDPFVFEQERCYTVRAVRGTGPTAIESEPSPRTCVRPVDVFPPAAPAAPAAVAAEGEISLIWEPNGELDLGGYLVLRGEAGDATLQPLTLAPIAETSYRDTTVMPGRRYVYAIVAVDDRVPLGNVSAVSPTVEETAR